MKDKRQIILSESERNELLELLRIEKEKRVAARLHCIRLLDEGWSGRSVAKALGINVDSVTDWKKIFLESGFEGLQRFNHKGSVSILDDYKDKIEKFILSKGVVISMDEACEFVSKKLKAPIGRRGIYDFFKKINDELFKR